MPTAQIAPASPVKIPATLEISKTSAPQTGLVSGETLEITVLEKLSGNKYMLALKTLRIPASSEAPLKTGEKLLVKVSTLQPQITLNIVDGSKQSNNVKVNEMMLSLRTNPDSLLQILGKVAGLSEAIQLADLGSKFPEKEVGKLIKLFDSIIFSSHTKANKLFVKDFVSQSGLHLEQSLSRLVTEGAKGSGKLPDDNLKILLLKLSDAIQETLKGASNLDKQAISRLTALAGFTTDALKTIEARQALNILYQQSDYGLALQIPLASGSTLTLADIFITPDDKNAQGEKAFSSCLIMIFLDFDHLGKISVNAGIRDGNFRSVIKCESQETKELITGALNQLTAALHEIGYHVDYIECLQEKGIERLKQEFVEQQSFSAQDLINYFA